MIFIIFPILLCYFFIGFWITVGYTIPTILSEDKQDKMPGALCLFIHAIWPVTAFFTFYHVTWKEKYRSKLSNIVESIDNHISNLYSIWRK